MDCIARVILLPDSSIHIACENKHSVACTGNALMSLVSDPLEFVSTTLLQYENTSTITNRAMLPLPQIPGLTLLYVETDRRVVCDFSELFSLLFSPDNQRDLDKSLSAKGLFSGDGFLDEKRALIKFFLDFNASLSSAHVLARDIGVSADTQSRVMQECLHTCFVQNHLPSVTASGDSSGAAEEAVSQSFAASIAAPGQFTPPQHYVSIAQFANIRGVNIQTALNWAKKGKLASAVQNPKSRKWWVDPADTPIDLRANRKSASKTGTKRKYFTRKSNSYEHIQEWIAQRKLFTEYVRPYLRTYEEAHYYEKNHYHEVRWKDQSALIIDINPEYVCTSGDYTGKSNREIILSGGSPVVPGNDSYVFDLHHIGQQKDSPLAIVPADIHKGGEMYSVFHQSSSGEKLHTLEYEKQKRKFWKMYLEMYDTYRYFSKIPFLNSKHKKAERK